MQGLRKQENDKFIKFFKLVQAEAAKQGSVFFIDCGQGDVFENDHIECEDMCGWLIPANRVSEFEPLFMENSPKQHDFDDLYCFVDYVVDGDTIEISIDESFDDVIVDDFNIFSDSIKKE
jgi:hypothetical protein